jgi:hypothetical protein
MHRSADRPRLFSVKRWRASHDLRVDIAYVVMALAILAGISALDTDPTRKAAAQVSQSASR